MSTHEPHLVNIRLLREYRKIRHEGMAERLGMSTSAYQRLESGETTLSVKRLRDIADALGVSYVDLLELNYPSLVNLDPRAGVAIGRAAPEASARWQGCPACNGTGVDPSVRLGSAAIPPCAVCNGQRIINTATGEPPRSRTA